MPELSEPFCAKVPVMFGPNISGSTYGSADVTWLGWTTTGAFDNGSTVTRLDAMQAASHPGPILTFDAKRSSTRYGASSTVQPASLRTLVLVKF